MTLRPFIDIAICEAHKSSMEHRHGCVIVHKNKAVITTHNYRVYVFSHGFSVHAEVEAIKHLRRTKLDPKECTMIVVRLAYDANSVSSLKFSKPCHQCQFEIEKAGFKRVFYST